MRIMLPLYAASRLNRIVLQKGYEDLASRCAIIATLMDRFNSVLAKVPSIPELGHLTYLDLRRTLSSQLAGKRYRQWWADELHPTPMGFREVAANFDRAIRRFPMPS